MRELENRLFKIFQYYVDDLEVVSFNMKKDIEKVLKRNIKDNNNIVKFTNYLYQKILMNFKKYHYTIKILDHNLVYISTYED